MSLTSQRATMTALFNFLNAKEVDKALALCSDSPAFEYSVRPASLNNLGQDNWTKATMAAFTKKFFEEHVDYMGYNTPREVVQEQDKIVLHYVTDGKHKDGSPAVAEYVFIIHFVPGTDKLHKMVQFMDSLAVTNSMAKSA